ncbi:Tigger transposable element-derived protein 1 [Dictyocoela muelleri]|nr:Tigger transposable element-derived protein 1 [Dictyocoela muelleri]
MKGFSSADVGVDYTSLTKAWMTTLVFKQYLVKLNEKMKTEGRKILLILDNAPSHPSMVLSNIEFLFLPKNTTSIIQPLDMGIIKAFKSHYFNALIDSCYFDKLDEEMDILTQ